jgi:hypothetical protein
MDDQLIFSKANVDPAQFLSQLAALNKVEEADLGIEKGGAPRDMELPDFFSALERVYLDAGGKRLGVTNKQDGTRESPFADFVTAILRFAPAGIGPSSGQAVAVAWQRSLRRNRSGRIARSPAEQSQERTDAAPAITSPNAG